MFELLIPDLYVAGLKEIPLGKLEDLGIKGLIIDLDNTVTEWNSPEITDEMLEWFAMLEISSLKVCLVSNNGLARVNYVAQKLNIPFIYKAGKPRKKAFRQAMQVMGTGVENTAVIGDQVFTDILGGNRLNLFTILVVPLAEKEFIGTRIVRQIERLVLKAIIRKETGEI